MPWYHAGKCQGDISVLRMRCTKCGKQWNPISFLLDPKGIRHFSIPKDEPTSHAKWGDSIPGVGEIAGHLPDWPRWARILAVSPVFVGILIGLLWGFGVIHF